MTKFKMKSVDLVEAYQITKEGNYYASLDLFVKWATDVGFKDDWSDPPKKNTWWLNQSNIIFINSEIGKVSALAGDWIVKDEFDDFYVLTDDIFKKNYEAVSKDSMSLDNVVYAMVYLSETNGPLPFPSKKAEAPQKIEFEAPPGMEVIWLPEDEARLDDAIAKRFGNRKNKKLDDAITDMNSNNRRAIDSRGGNDSDYVHAELYHLNKGFTETTMEFLDNFTETEEVISRFYYESGWRDAEKHHFVAEAENADKNQMPSDWLPVKVA